MLSVCCVATAVFWLPVGSCCLASKHATSLFCEDTEAYRSDVSFLRASGLAPVEVTVKSKSAYVLNSPEKILEDMVI